MHKMVDMRKTPEELKDNSPMVTPDQNIYPWGLCIRLGNEEIEKLGLDCECEVGDMLPFSGLAFITSFSKNATESGESRNIELQIRYMSIASEEEENESPDALKSSKMQKKMYNGG